MMIQEFEELTGTYPSGGGYEVIEEFYYQFKGDKTEFCKAYAKNKDSIAEKIQAEINKREASRLAKKEREIAYLKSLIDDEKAKAAELQKQLEREQDRKDHEIEGDVSQKEYEHLASSSREMTDDEAKQLIADDFGFCPEKILIRRTASMI